MNVIGSVWEAVKPVWDVVNPIWVVVGPAAGFGLKSVLENKKKKKINSSESKDSIEQAVHLISAKYFSIGRDIELYKFTGSNIAGLNEFPVEWIPSQKELNALSRGRMIDDCTEIISMDLTVKDKDFKEFEENIRSFMHECRNLKRIMENKEFDELKISVIQTVDEKLKESHGKIMNDFRNF
ncbi:hypothetical protein [Planococcus halotolerans]|uniref:Uncharacterized protein n=1 Tax=Planococcus halotolerans TaxID=2233542 RepID=A0A365KKF5_9BACL|nr:hypothetical protein [Planococcus halotolerans]RAZ73612.1 hypothetical protein DP120_16890 [Planococcus halotolerans]